MIKILHVIAEMDPQLGGVCKAVRTIINGMAHHNNIVNEVLSTDDPKSNFLKNDNFTVHALGKVENAWGYHKNMTDWLKNNASGFHHIIIHGLWLYPSYSVFKAIKNLNAPPKYHSMPHGMLDPYFQKASGRKFKAIRNYIYWKFVESKVINNADTLLFTCEEERHLANSSFKPYRPKNEHIIGMGVEEPPVYNSEMKEAFFKACPAIKNKSFLLFLSRIHEKKGVIMLLDAYLQFLKEFEKKELSGLPVLVIAGPGMDSPYGTLIQNKLQKNPILKDMVFFPGMIQDEEKWGAFYHCDAFILPSHQENFGIAVVEALACSKPVLISNQVNIWREIAQDKAGFVEEDTVEGTLKLLNNWYEASNKNSYDNNALSCYTKNYSMPTFVNNWKDFLSEFKSVGK